MRFLHHQDEVVNIQCSNMHSNSFSQAGEDESKSGEVSRFQALTTALSATGGIECAGVAIAIGMGGPGNLLDDSCRFSWNVLKIYRMYFGKKYRKIRKDGKIMGGAMHYLSDGLKEKKLKHLGGLLAGLFVFYA